MRKKKIHVVTIISKDSREVSGHTSANKANAYVLNHIAKYRDDFDIDPTMPANQVKENWHTLTHGQGDWSVDACLIIS